MDILLWIFLAIFLVRHYLHSSTIEIVQVKSVNVPAHESWNDRELLLNIRSSTRHFS